MKNVISKDNIVCLQQYDINVFKIELIM